MPADPGHALPRLAYRLLLLAALLLPAASVRAIDGGEAALKVAFLYNFALYTEWPSLGPAFEICVVGKAGLGEALDALARKEIAGRPIRIRRLDAGPVSAECNLLFVAAESERLGALLAPLAARPVLTVAENDAAPPARPMLRLALDQGRLSFDVNQTAARAAGLSFSAKLLRLARNVN